MVENNENVQGKGSVNEIPNGDSEKKPDFIKKTGAFFKNNKNNVLKYGAGLIAAAGITYGILQYTSSNLEEKDQTIEQKTDTINWYENTIIPRKDSVIENQKQDLDYFMVLDSMKTSALNFTLNNGIYSNTQADSIDKQVSEINQEVNPDSVKSDYVQQKMDSKSDSSYTAEKSSVDTSAVSTVSDKAYKTLTEDSAKAEKALESIAKEADTEKQKQKQQAEKVADYEGQKTSGEGQRKDYDVSGTSGDKTYKQMECMFENAKNNNHKNVENLDDLYDCKSQDTSTTAADTCACDVHNAAYNKSR